ncbi:hypothetical protein L1049_014609 [Liquidambar formosana]|uniref:AAA-type ATPase N-terminal domain-containing protein n=1 Tax=Liquidambar formosana TaxID=63359 RepID=A0AAP0X5J1_LIQFO
MPSTKTVISTAASVAASAMLIHSIARRYIPYELRDYIYSQFRTFLSSFSSQITLVIEEFEGLDYNQLFKAADTYLRTIIPPETRKFRVSLAPKATNISVSMERN